MTDQPLPMVFVRYTCKPCGLTQRRVTVPARASQAVDVVAWMNLVRHYIGNDHAHRSPFCRATKFELMIPIPTDGGYIGAPLEKPTP